MCNLMLSKMNNMLYLYVLLAYLFRQLRINLLPKYYHIWPSMYKFKQPIKSDKLSLLRKLSKYIYMANAKRESKTVP